MRGSRPGVVPRIECQLGWLSGVQKPATAQKQAEKHVHDRGADEDAPRPEEPRADCRAHCGLKIVTTARTIVIQPSSVMTVRQSGTQRDYGRESAPRRTAWSYCTPMP
jgi:hypothetical protein